MRASGYAPNFTPPSRQSPSRRMWVIVALCVFLPPVGLILLWMQARNPLRGKLIVSIIALLSMTLMLTLYISAQNRNALLMQQVPPDYTQMMGALASPTPAPTVPQEGNAGGAPAQSAAGQTDPTPAPANPNR